jgi:hypothetical protein
MKKFLVAILAACLVGTFFSCKQPFFAGEGSTLEIFTESANIEFNESVTVFIRGYNADGTPLWDGTRVDLTIVNGTLSTYQVELEDGAAQVTATGNVDRGEMKISARSGEILATEISLNVGTHPEVSDIVILANPQFLPAGGGASAITVYLYDEYYQPIPNRAVLITAPKGSISNQGLPFYTNSEGAAHATLTTSQGTWVYAKSGNAEDGKIYVFVGGE